jgi:hypothetical protein
MEKKPSLGLQIIIISLTLQGALFIFITLPYFGYLISKIGTPALDTATRQSDVIGLVYSAIAASFGIWCIIDAIWISKLKKIGLNLGMIIIAFSLLLTGFFIISNITQGMSLNWIQYYTAVSLFFVITYGSCFYYLTRPKVTEQFK